jgi:membrane fusion protein (multidrug efflux system)
MRKLLIVIIVVVVVGILFAVRLAISGKGPQREEESRAIPVEVMTVTRNTVESTCELIGTLYADKTAQVFPETVGRITRIFVNEGSYVSKGSKIMALRNETIGFEYEEGFITAPISGNIATVMVDAGSMVSPQTPVAVVVEYSRVEAALNVSENALGCIQKGSTVKVVVDALPDTSFSGKVSEMSPVIDPMTRTIAVKARVDNPKKLLKPGMTARVILTLGLKKNVIAIPRDALLDSYLFVVKDSVAERRDIEVGLIGDEYIEVLAGLSEGEKVVVVGQQRLAGGENVNPVQQGRFEDVNTNAGSE